MKNEWAYALEEDSDSFQGCATREEAISEGENAARDMEQADFWVAPVVPVQLSELVEGTWSGGDIAEMLIESNYDQMPEGHEEKWLAMASEAQLKELEENVRDTILAWLTRHEFRPTWYGLGTPVRIEVGHET